MSGFIFEEITTSTPEKSLLAPLKKKGGRNNNGRITVRHHGGGHKRRYRIIDFNRNKQGIPAKVASVEYDPNRSARISLLHYVDGEKRYILTPAGLKVGDVILSGENADIKTGNALPLKNIPVGTLLHCIELRPRKGAQLGRSAGAAIQLMAKGDDYAQLKLRSGEIRKVRILTVCICNCGLQDFHYRFSRSVTQCTQLRHCPNDILSPDQIYNQTGFSWGHSYISCCCLGSH